MFEHQFRHEVVGLETKFFWLPLAQQTSFMSSTSLINLSDQEPRYQHFRDRFLWRKLLDTFSIIKLTRQYIRILLQFVLPIIGIAPTVTHGLALMLKAHRLFLKLIPSKRVFLASRQQINLCAVGPLQQRESQYDWGFSGWEEDKELAQSSMFAGM